MLSRVAEALFWVGRYVERAEDTARLLDVHFHEVLEDPDVDEVHACAVLLAIMGVPGDTAKRYRDSRAVLELLGYDEDAPSSIVGALSAAWQSARSAREALSAEIWECLNSTHNSLPARVAAARDFGPAPFFSYVRERAAIVAGYVESSMSRDASYDALVLGRSLERVDMIARLLAARIGAGQGSEGWTSTLRACSAYDAYLRTYQQGVEAPRVVEFLLVDRLFPRSVFFALSAGERALARLDPASGRSGLDEPAHRAIGRARTDLEFLSAANLLDGLPDRLLGLQRAVSTISKEVTQRLFAGSPPPQWSLKEPVA
ncbi:MAG TPA: alpha-E domain-containing protein [Trebonia sp.]